LLTNQSIEAAAQLADKARITMSNSKPQRKDSGETIGKVTVSAGITALKTDDSTDSFIGRADKALHEVKETGRNKIVLSE
jgi:diguanylate cyclase